MNKYVWLVMETIPYDGSQVAGIYTSEEEKDKALAAVNEDEDLIINKDFLHILKVKVNNTPFDDVVGIFNANLRQDGGTL